MKRATPKRGGGRTGKKNVGSRKKATTTRRTTITKRRATAGPTRSRSADGHRGTALGRGLKERNHGIQRNRPFDREEDEVRADGLRERAERGSNRPVGARRTRMDEDDEERRERKPNRPEPDQPVEGSQE